MVDYNRKKQGAGAQKEPSFQVNALNVLWVVTFSFSVHCIPQVGANTRKEDPRYLFFLAPPHPIICLSPNMVLGFVVLWVFFESQLRSLAST